MQASEAVQISSEWFAALTGANLKHIYARRRGIVVDTARNLAGYLFYEVIGPTKPEGWLTKGAKTAKRDHSTVRACALKYDWRAGTISQRNGKDLITTNMCGPDIARDMDRLFAWLEVHWSEPLAIHRELIAKARRRFREALRYWRKKRGSKRLRPEDIARAVAALGRAVPKVEPRATAVPIVDEPLPMRVLRQAPIGQSAQELSVEPAYGGGWYISAMIAGAGRKMEEAAKDILQDMVRALDSLHFKAKQSAFSPMSGGGFKAVLHVAASAMLALSPVFAPWHDGRTEVTERV